MTDHRVPRAAFVRIAGPLLAAVVAVANTPSSHAHDGHADSGGRAKAQSGDSTALPLLAIDGVVELRFADFFASDDWANRRIDVTLRSEALFGFYVVPGLSLQGRLKAESVRAPKPGRDRFLAGTGAFLEELYVDYDSERFGLYAGKFNPAFGLAWRQFGELLKEGFADRYEIAEMTGLGGALKFDLGVAGRHELNAALFFVDTSILHRSLFAQPGAGEERAGRVSHLRRRDGGLANTGELNSFALALDGGDFDFPHGLSYHLGFRHLHRGAGQRHGESALAFGLAYEFALDGVTVSPFAEIVRFWNIDGEGGNGLAFSAGIAASYQRFAWQGGFSLRHATVAAIDGPDRRDWMAGTQLVYGLCEGLGLGVGYRHERVERVHTDQLRVFMAYEFGMKHALGK